MKLFRKKLPHLPLDDDLPFITSKPLKIKHWRTENIKQQVLAQDLENINRAIIDLREKHQDLKKRTYKEAEVKGFKHHLPIIMDSPENMSFFEEELAGIQQELSDLETSKIGKGFAVYDIPPMPPTPLTVFEKLIKTRPESKIKPTLQKDFRELSLELQKITTNKGPEPKTLLERLRYGVIELQNKWTEVQGKLDKVDYVSPQVNEQLLKLNSELNLLEKTSIDSPYIITLVPKTTGIVKELSKQKRKQAKKEISDILSNITAEDIPPYELLQVKKHLADLENSNFPKPYISSKIPATGHITFLPNKQIKILHSEVKDLIASFSVVPIEYRDRLTKINEKISKKYIIPQCVKINKLSNYVPREYFTQEFLEQQKKLNKIRENLRKFPRKPEKTGKLKRVNKKLSQKYHPKHSQFVSKSSSEPGRVKPLKESQIKKAKQEISKSLSVYKKDKRVRKRMHKIYKKMHQDYSPIETNRITKLSDTLGNITELPLSVRKNVHKEVRESLSNLRRSSHTIHKMKVLEKEMTKKYNPKNILLIDKMSAYQGQVKPVKNAKKKIKEMHAKISKNIADSKTVARKTKSIDKINRKIIKKYQPQRVKYHSLEPLLPEYIVPASDDAMKRADKEVKQILNKAESLVSYDALKEVREKILAAEYYKPSKVRVGNIREFKTLPYQEKPDYLNKELSRVGKRKIFKDKITITPELIALNKKISNIAKAKLQKNKVAVKIKKEKDPNELRLEKELQDTRSILARAIKDPSILLGKLKTKVVDRKKLAAEKKAKSEVLRILAKIDGALERPPNKLLQIKKDLDNLKNVQIETGKKITKQVKYPVTSNFENQILKREQLIIEKKIANEPEKLILKNKDLLEVERKLAELKN
jgi:hypothetical protein